LRLEFEKRWIALWFSQTQLSTLVFPSFAVTHFNLVLAEFDVESVSWASCTSLNWNAYYYSSVEAEIITSEKVSQIQFGQTQVVDAADQLRFKRAANFKIP